MTHHRFSNWLVAVGLALLASVSAATAEPAPVDINTASIAQLDELNGIGAAKAQAIVDYREKNGPFATVDDLRNVKGIGDKLLAELRPQLTIGSAAGRAAKPSKQ
jgi:competence protein ComEA